MPLVWSKIFDDKLTNLFCIQFYIPKKLTIESPNDGYELNEGKKICFSKLQYCHHYHIKNDYISINLQKLYIVHDRR